VFCDVIQTRYNITIHTALWNRIMLTDSIEENAKWENTGIVKHFSPDLVQRLRVWSEM